ncbi:MAG: PilZ domain-containing protein [Thermodesulfobacteriota bacterium]
MPVGEDRRQELRVPLPVQVWFNVLDPGEEYVRADTALASARKSTEPAPELEGRDEVERFLIRLDQKLDLVISLLVEKISRKQYQHKALAVDVSESGLRITSSLPLAEGTRVELGLIVPSQPYRTMDIGGEVVWVEGGGAPGRRGPARIIGLRFTDILPQDQDEIVHWIFQKQREEIRRLKEQD